jgi:hypothetical protein
VRVHFTNSKLLGLDGAGDGDADPGAGTRTDPRVDQFVPPSSISCVAVESKQSLRMNCKPGKYTDPKLTDTQLGSRCRGPGEVLLLCRYRTVLQLPMEQNVADHSPLLMNGFA